MWGRPPDQRIQTFFARWSIQHMTHRPSTFVLSDSGPAEPAASAMRFFRRNLDFAGAARGRQYVHIFAPPDHEFRAASALLITYFAEGTSPASISGMLGITNANTALPVHSAGRLAC